MLSSTACPDYSGKSRHAGKILLQTLFFFLLVTQICVAQWIQTGPYGGNVSSFAVSGTNLFAGTYGGGVFLSTNNGTSWTAVNSGLYHPDVLALAVSGTNLFAGTSGSFGSGGGVFLSTNNGTSWTAVNSGLPYTNVRTLAVSGTNLFAGAFESYGVDGGVFLSINNGTSWTAVNSGLTNTNVLALAVSGTNLFAGAFESYGVDGGVFLSTNNGTSWTEVNSGLTNTNVRALAVSDTNLFAGTGGGGVWRRPLSEIVPVELTSFTATANGKEVILNWSTATELNNQGFEIERASSKTSPRQEDWGKIGFVPGFGTTTEPKSYSYSDQSVNTGTFYYRLKQIDYDGSYEYSGVVEVDFRTFNSYLLEQNYPNPFNPSTKISWQSPVGSQQTLKIYDILGNEVAALVDEYRSAGRYEVEFSASALPSGVYFYQLKATPNGGQAGSFVETKKMLLLK